MGNNGDMGWKMGLFVGTNGAIMGRKMGLSGAAMGPLWAGR